MVEINRKHLRLYSSIKGQAFCELQESRVLFSLHHWKCLPVNPGASQICWNLFDGIYHSASVQQGGFMFHSEEAV